MAASVVIGAAFSVIYQKISVIDVIKAALIGFHPNIPSRIQRCSFRRRTYIFQNYAFGSNFTTSLNGMFEGTKIVETLVEPILKRIKTPKCLLLFTIAFSIVSALFMCNQVISIIIPAGVLMSRYKDMDIDKRVFARLLSDSGVMISSIIPWNVAALTPATIMGVEVMDFMPYAFLSYIMPIIAVVYVMSFYNYNLKEKRGKTNEETYSQAIR